MIYFKSDVSAFLERFGQIHVAKDAGESRK